jgi:predicted transposase YbfD/YdcC
MRKFRRAFKGLPDPRAENASFELIDILFIALAAVMSGAETASDMEQYGRGKEFLLRSMLPLEHGTPSHDTFSRVFRLLEPAAFERAFRRFMAVFAKANGLTLNGVIAIDGKALRGAYERGRAATPLHMVNVFAVAARMVLSMRKARGRNEAGGALEVLEMLSLRNCVVTADALHCHRRFAQTVLSRGGHYVLALKRNQSKLFRLAESRFAASGKRTSVERLEPSTHDRREKRRATVIRDNTLSAAFPGVVALGRVTSRRQMRGKRADSPLVRYYLISKLMSATNLLKTVRAHWGIENRLHWVLDADFGEDADRARKDNAPENLAILRRLALNIARSHPAAMSMRLKLKRAGWDDNFLLTLLTHMR